MSRRGPKLSPPLEEWFDSRFAGYSDSQRAALPHTLRGENTLILAPTGSGKTLAAFLSILSRLHEEAAGAGLPNAVRAVYVSPLKALDNDIHRNLAGPLEAINQTLPSRRRVRMEVRTGDTALAARSRQQRTRPHLLLTTVETLSSLLSQKSWQGALRPHSVVVDEIHAFAENKRGSLLALVLERLEDQAGLPLQRIGLSATASPPERVARFLCGSRACAVAAVDARKAHRLTIAVPSTGLPASGHSPYRAAHLAGELIEKAKCTLAFTITRSAAERLGVALKVILPAHEERTAVHHSSVEKAERLAIEAGLARGEYKTVVCSTSLELGVDFEHVDQVLLVGAPHGVSSALQRLGRSGHRLNGVADGKVLPVTLPDLLESIALVHAAGAGRLDELRIPGAPLDVLAQTLLGMSIGREWGEDEAFSLICRAGPYARLARTDFDGVLEYLAGGGTVLGPYGTYGKIVRQNGRFAVASAKVAREYYQNIGTISDEYQIQIWSKGNRKLGAVTESFLASLAPGQAFAIGGKPVRVKQWIQNKAIVEPAAGEPFLTPRWMGSKMSLTMRLADEEKRLRRDLRRAWQEGGSAACCDALKRDWGVPAAAAALAAEFVRRQNLAAPVPVDDPVQVERIEEGRRCHTIFHVLAGRAANHALSWVCAHRLREAGSIVANYDDRSFLLTMDRRRAPDPELLRACFAPENWREDLRAALSGTETLGRDFRHIAETGQLLKRRTLVGPVSPKSASWSGSLLYQTFLRYEPDHPLVRETIREYLEDKMDERHAHAEAARLFAAPWEVFHHPRPSPFALPVYAASNVSTLLAQDPGRALEDLAEHLYEKWNATG